MSSQENSNLSYIIGISLNLTAYVASESTFSLTPLLCYKALERNARPENDNCELTD